jgi:hypothetical protein
VTALELMDGLGEVDEELVLPVLAAPARRLRRKALRIALIAAAVLALLALAALAASESGLLERYFPGSYDLISDYVTHVEAVTENEILRLTLHEAVTDGARTLVAYTVERLDGGGMAGWEPEAEITPHYMGGRVFSGGSRSGTTIDQSETAKRTYLWCCSSTDETALESVSIRLLGLKSTVNRGEQLDAGSLTLEASLNACPVRMAKRLGSAGDEDLVVSVRISPLSLRVLSYRNLAGMKPGDVEKKEDIHTVGGPSDRRVELLFRDGSRQHVSMRHRSTDSSGIVVLMGDFWDLPDVSRVKAVVIDGREYPLTKETAPAPRQGLGRDAPFLESQRAWLYGSHEPAHPALTAAGEAVTLALDGIWTDGYTTELMLMIGGPQEEADIELVNVGGNLTFDARDRQGEVLAVGVRDGGLTEGLLSLIVECSDKAAQLTIGDRDASLVIPLDMKKLSKLPQIEPKAARPRQTAAPEAGETYAQAAYDRLFAGVTPDDTGYSADNGIFRLTVVHLYLAEEPGVVKLRAWVEAERLDDEPYDMRKESRQGFTIRGLKDGEEIHLDGGVGHQGGVNGGVRNFSISEDYRYGDFELAAAQGAGVLPAEGLDLETLDLDGLRLTWTPPEGGRITLDLPMGGGKAPRAETP